MSAICQHIESAFVRFLITTAGEGNLLANSFALATHASQVHVTPTGLLVTIGDSQTFAVSIYSGESEEKVTLPAIVVVCDNGQRMDDVANIQTCTVEVSMEVQCDSTSAVNSVAWTYQASRWLHDLLSGGIGIARDIEAAEPGLVVSYISPAECGRSVDGRRRIHRWSLQVVASI